MGLRTAAHRLAIWGEQLIERLWRGDERKPVLEPYFGYATPKSLVLRGRVLTRLRHATPKPGQSRLTNLRQMFSLFLTHEVANVRVTVPGHDVAATTDAEGYVTIEVPRRSTFGSGWLVLPVKIDGADGPPVDFPVRVPRDEARIGVISDIDDTVMRTGAYSLVRNLWTTFTGSALTRDVFSDSAVLLNDLAEGGRNPIFYVSSSPWNLHDFLADIFARGSVPRGPKFLRDLGVSETQFVSGTHRDHKGSAIDRILAANPDLPFLLIGDTGQHDAEVYLAAIERHGPERMAGVILRQPGPGPNATSREAMAAIEAAGVPLWHDRSFAPHRAAILDRAASVSRAAGMPDRIAG